jgi:hypothetical protein
MGVALAIALVAFLGAHLAIAAVLTGKGRWGRGALALVVPPLAPWWAWDRRVGARPLAIAWLAAFAAYAALTVAAGH